MQNIFNDNVDLDALFDLLNLVGRSAAEAPDSAGSTPVSQLDTNSYQAPDLSPLEADFFIFDLPSDQS